MYLAALFDITFPFSLFFDLFLQQYFCPVAIERMIVVIRKITARVKLIADM